MKYLGLFFTLLALPPLTSCSTTKGNAVVGESSKDEVYRIINDQVSTKSDARRVFSDPSDIDFDNQGNEKWTYTHITQTSMVRNYIPVVNFFTKGTDDTHKKIVLIFDPKGTLIKSAVSESKGETKW